MKTSSRLVLGIECTAHTLGVGVARGSMSAPFGKSTRILSNESAKYPSLREGFIPRKLADHHAKHFKEVALRALDKASIKPRDLDAVAYSYGPGLGHSLHVGFVAAKTLCESLGIPLVGVNHALAHAEVGRFFTRMRAPVVAYVSGGNTQILRLGGKPGKRHYQIVGETLDIGAGNMLDLVGRNLSLSPPDAVGVLEAARKGRNLVPLPYSVKGMNMSFSGLLTASQKAVASPPDLCYSVQETAFSMICECAEKALSVYGAKELLLVGGNARNKRLSAMLALAAKEHNARFGAAPLEYCGDNGGMIALAGLFQLSKRIGLRRLPSQRARIDAESVAW
ncbi:MAG: tRNA (adenosine(37)-N6)-threonylcarbamoyltransferase complex transferase subunit TsaD [Candidatus Micrarchaeota archaeon]